MMRMTLPVACLPWFVMIACLVPGLARAQSDLPTLEVREVRRAFHNGEHNAFTDLCEFRGRYYLAFRSCPDGHGVNPTASIIVLGSDDTREWTPVVQFSVAKRDTRDPHFLVFNDRLFVYTGTWYCGDGKPDRYDANEQLGYAVWTEDGRAWSEPTMLEGTYGHYIWRAAAHDGKAYLCGRRKHQFARTEEAGDAAMITESALLESDDGLIWRTRGFFQLIAGNETAFAIEPEGRIVAVARSGGSRPAQICRSDPPYQQWQRVDLDRNVGGPLIAKWNDRYLVGGRKTVGGSPRTVLSWLEGDQLHDVVELPSGGDNSYPGFVQLDADRALISWYSSHEKDDRGRSITAIYLAELHWLR